VSACLVNGFINGCIPIKSSAVILGGGSSIPIILGDSRSFRAVAYG